MWARKNRRCCRPANGYRPRVPQRDNRAIGVDRSHRVAPPSLQTECKISKTKPKKEIKYSILCVLESPVPTAQLPTVGGVHPPHVAPHRPIKSRQRISFLPSPSPRILITPSLSFARPFPPSALQLPALGAKAGAGLAASAPPVAVPCRGSEGCRPGVDLIPLGCRRSQAICFFFFVCLGLGRRPLLGQRGG